ncbi:MAG TPA: EamA family transporter RarD, partial [Oligoflexia bacterium]|nr:EamA family transporter RarD [Oligoflexia bacterium]
AFAAWGVLPAYWRLLFRVEPEVILFHRILWSVVLLGLMLAARGQLGTAFSALRQRSALLMACGAVLSLGVNWYVYIWAMINNELVASGLGYIICPVLTVLLGSLACGEKLLGHQRAALVMMAAGVVLRAFALGRFPSVALVLAVSFALYSFFRKRSGVMAIAGLLFECMLLLVPAAMIVHSRGLFAGGAFWGGSPWESALLVMSGAVTALPLLLLAQGMPAVTLKFVGVAQYLAPTLTLLLAVLVYGEKLVLADYLSFPVIWLGVVMFLFGHAAQLAIRPSWICKSS